MLPEIPPVAHAREIKRITITRLRKALHLTGHCEMCGDATLNVAFFDRGIVAEICAGCAGEANRRVGK